MRKEPHKIDARHRVDRLTYNPGMPNTRASIANAIEARSPITIAGEQFALELTGFREPLPHHTQQIHVAFSAMSTTTRHNGELHLAVDGYSDDEIADLAVDTIHQIARGDLPPGTTSQI